MEPRINFQDAPKGMYDVMLNIENYLKKSGISHSLLHLIKVRSSQINGCGYCLDMHHKDALAAGETVQRLYLLSAWREAPVYSESEKAALNLAEVLTNISDADPEIVAEAYNLAAQHYSKTDIAYLVLAICQINSWNRMTITFGTVPGTYKGHLTASPEIAGNHQN